MELNLNDHVTEASQPVSYKLHEIFKQRMINLKQNNMTMGSGTKWKSPPGYLAKVLEAIKFNKAGGTDGLAQSVLKSLPPSYVCELQQYFDMLINNYTDFDAAWANVMAVMLPKVRKTVRTSGCRMIILADTLQKLWTKLVFSFVVPNLDDLPEVQCAQAGHQSLELTQVIQLIMIQGRNMRHSGYIIKLDCKNAFDSVSHVAVLDAFEQFEALGPLIAALMQQYMDCTLTAHLGDCSTSVKLDKGIRQGGPDSSRIFMQVLVSGQKRLLAKWSRLRMGFQVGVDEWLQGIFFSDDWVLFCKDKDEISVMIADVVDMLDELQMALQPTKSQYIGVNVHSFNEMTIQGVVISPANDNAMEVVGMMMTGDAELQGDKAAAHRCSRAWQLFFKLRHIVLNHAVPLRMRLHAVERCVRPCFLWGCQLWPLSSASQTRQAMIQKEMTIKVFNCGRKRFDCADTPFGTLLQRRLDNIRRARAIQNNHGIDDWGAVALKLTWNWFGHLCRHELMPTQILAWCVLHQHSAPLSAHPNEPYYQASGRPLSAESTIQKFVCENEFGQKWWREVADDRGVWSDLARKFVAKMRNNISGKQLCVEDFSDQTIDTCIEDDVNLHEPCLPCVANCGIIDTWQRLAISSASLDLTNGTMALHPKPVPIPIACRPVLAQLASYKPKRSTRVTASHIIDGYIVVAGTHHFCNWMFHGQICECMVIQVDHNSNKQNNNEPKHEKNRKNIQHKKHNNNKKNIKSKKTQNPPTTKTQQTTNKMKQHNKPTKQKQQTKHTTTTKQQTK